MAGFTCVNNQMMFKVLITGQYSLATSNSTHTLMDYGLLCGLRGGIYGLGCCLRGVV